MQQVISDSITALISRRQQLKAAGEGRRLLVGITGGPGSGKSELALAICREVNRVSGQEICRVVGMDGWHYSRAELDKFPDPVDAHQRRGAHDTFDAAAYHTFVERLRTSSGGDTIRAPSFSHSLKDPVADDIVIGPDHQIVLIEGLYVALDFEPWASAARLLDERWVILLHEQLAEERIWRRHVASGICDDEGTARSRAVNNDIPNGRFLLSRLVDTTRVIESVEDPVLAPNLNVPISAPAPRKSIPEPAANNPALVIASPFFRHEIIDKVISQTPGTDMKTTLALLASKVRLCEDDLAATATSSGDAKPRSIEKLLEARMAYATCLMEDVQIGKAEAEALKLLEFGKGIERQNGETEYPHRTVQVARKTQVYALDLLREIDESLGKQGRVKRWDEQKAKLLERTTRQEAPSS